MRNRKLTRTILGLALTFSMLMPATAFAEGNTGNGASATSEGTAESATDVGTTSKETADSNASAGSSESEDVGTEDVTTNETGSVDNAPQSENTKEMGDEGTTVVQTSIYGDAATDSDKIKVIVDIAEAKWTNTTNNGVTTWDSGNIGIHYWGDGITGPKWASDPKMAKVDGQNGQYAYEVPKGTTGMIFRSMGSPAMQTVDISDIRSDVTYYVQPVSGAADVGAPKAEVIMKDANGNVVKPEEKQVDSFKVKYDNSFTKWDSVSIHYWGKGITGTTWPGNAMTKSSGNPNIFEANVPVGATGIVFDKTSNPNSKKSADVTDLPNTKDATAEYVAVAKENGLYVVLRKDENGNTYEPSENPTTEEMKAQQINTHVGKDYSQVILSYTTVGETDGNVTVVSSAGDKKELTASKTFSYNAEKFKYVLTIKNLKADTKYTYTIGSGDSAKTGTFTTMPAPGSDKALKFAYLCDTQVGSESTAEATSALFHYLNNEKDLGFIYIGGDVTDNGDSKEQWEYLFNSPDGQYKDDTAAALSNNLLAVCQGNHDKNHDTSSLNGYINAPADGGNLVYSINYGKVRFIVLNLETAKTDDDERATQEAYLEKQVQEAKAAGQWTIVGFHKSIYTGASHLVDADIVAARQYWSPILSKLGVDMVLQAHDHVLARGFVNGDGTRGDSNGNITKDESGAYVTNEKAPLYMVGGHAGGLKWYSALTQDGKVGYSIAENDPLLPAYSFLDVDSANPDLMGDKTTDKTHETMYTVFSINADAIISTTYAFGYDQKNHKVTTEPYVYDTFILKKAATPAENTDDNEYTATEETFTNPNNNATYVWYTRNSDGEKVLFKDGKIDSNEFVSDGNYTYFCQADGTVMKDRLTYHPTENKVIYFDTEGHEVFNAFTHVSKSIEGKDVDDYCYFDVHGYMYVNTVTYNQEGTKLYYINPYGKMEHTGWFTFDENTTYGGDENTKWTLNATRAGYAGFDGSIMTNQDSYDLAGRPIYFQANGEAMY